MASVPAGTWAQTAHTTEAPHTIVNGKDLGPPPTPLDQAEDLVGAQPENAKIIGPPLSNDVVNCTDDPSGQEQKLCMRMNEFQVIRESLWAFERDYDRAKPGKLMAPDIMEQLAFIHLMKGLPIRYGDYNSLHGMILAAIRPDTFILAKKWQNYMECFRKGPECKPLAY